MPIWPALFVAPSFALTHLSVAFALVTPACAAQATGWLHLSSAVFFVAAVLMTGLAVAEARRRAGTSAAPPGADSDAGSGRPYFTAWVAALVGLLSCLVIAAIWIPQWLLSPCAA